ncbi:MAG TPA: M13 family metallopeptidase [Thermoanaerobaculia bacterium]|nr:M13 family metallopeptidase [Thermoanaerobaculia bacterium]
MATKPFRSIVRLMPAAIAGLIVLAASPDNAPTAPRLTTLDVAGMDTSAQACTDFYRYGNGGWLEKNPIPSDRPRWGSSDELRQRNLDDLHRILEKLGGNRSAPAGSDERKLGDFYGACMDEAAIESKGLSPIEPELAKIDAIHDAASLRAAIVHLQDMGVNALFNFGSEEDRKDSSRVIAAAVQGGLGLPDRDYYTKTDAKSVETRQKYAAHVAKMLELAGSPAAKASTDAQTILALETKLAEASQNNVDIRDPDKTHHPMTLAALSKATPNLAWETYFQEQKIPAGVEVNVWEPDFFHAADRLIRSEPLSAWKTYLRWQLLTATAGTLPKRFVDENFAFYGKTLAGTPEIQPRWKRCVTATDNAMGMALGRIYVQEYFPPAAKKRADELVKNLLAALSDDLQALTWMGEATKKAAAAKVAAIRPKIGYPDKWRDYSALDIVPGSYAVNALAANQFEARRDLAKIGKPVDRYDWGMTPPTVNAYYNAAKNEIVFPAGIFQPPFFYAEGDDAINYGAIGAVIGHEITHGFDNSGRKFDAKGNQVDWWTAEDAKNFDERAACIIKQFDGYFVEADLHENGELVQGEAIADLGGLTIAYRAYQISLKGKPEPAPIDGLTADQRFFVANARIWAANHRPEFARLIVQTNEHPLGQYRSVGTVSNMPEFARAFACQPGAAMVRAERCQIW